MSIRSQTSRLRALIWVHYRSGDLGRGWVQTISVFRVRQFIESPEPLQWFVSPVEFVTKAFIHWMPFPHSVKRRFSSLIYASSHPLSQTPFQHYHAPQKPEEFQKPQPLLVSEKVLQYPSNMYGSTPPICIAVPPWLLNLEEMETQQYTTHLYGSTPPICTAILSRSTESWSDPESSWENTPRIFFLIAVACWIGQCVRGKWYLGAKFWEGNERRRCRFSESSSSLNCPDLLGELPLI